MKPAETGSTLMKASKEIHLCIEWIELLLWTKSNTEVLYILFFFCLIFFLFFTALESSDAINNIIVKKNNIKSYRYASNEMNVLSLHSAQCTANTSKWKITRSRRSVDGVCFMDPDTIRMTAIDSIFQQSTSIE